MNIIIDIGGWSKPWFHSYPGAVGGRIGWFGLFWIKNDVINANAFWKRKAEKAEKELAELRQAVDEAAPAIQAILNQQRELDNKVEEVDVDVDIDVLSQRRDS